jgi:hypothetical protein
MIDYSESFKISGCRLDNLELEEKKITAAHFGYMFYLKKHLYNDGGWHNLRAFLINRVEQLSDYALIVSSNDNDWNPEFKIRDRKTYLKEKYGIDWNRSFEQKGQ